MHPIAFQLGSFGVHWYGVMIALAFLIGLWTATRRARRENIPGERIADLVFWIMILGMIGARTVYVTTYWSEFAHQPLSEIFMIQHGGLVYYGCVIGGAIAYFIYIRWNKLRGWKIADILAPSIALGNAFGRIGCLLNGCCYGRECHLPWAIRFPNQSAAWQQHFQAGLVGRTDPSLPVHPTELYDAALNFLLYLGLAWLFRHKKFDGQVFAWYLVGYGLLRFTVEFYRGDYPPDHIHHGLTSAQLVSLPIFVVGLALAAIRSRRSGSKR
ncbi:MAG TPA: prolipoprotein diacylglyceryl transferase [Candidatus Acidoferrum sp.]|nr:prolipoprotein diacylglyceryl transferase [Candidatus Acidoferrum sp.]